MSPWQATSFLAPSMKLMARSSSVDKASPCNAQYDHPFSSHEALYARLWRGVKVGEEAGEREMDKQRAKAGRYLDTANIK